MKLEVKEGIKIEIHNKDTSIGCHYPEDDWDIEAVATTYEKAIERIIPKYIESGIYPSGNYISDVKYVTYNSKQCVVDDTDKTPPMYKYKDIVADIKKHPLFKKLLEEKEKKIESKRQKRVLENKRENEENERELLKKLVKKHNNDTWLWNYYHSVGGNPKLIVKEKI